jgi:DNA-directed RNA polymerase specialized sigma24 family protein
MSAENITEVDRRIMKLRALGYSQAEIAAKLGVTQSAVSQRIQKIRRTADQSQDAESAFWTLLVGLGALYLLSRVLDNRNQ